MPSACGDRDGQGAEVPGRLRLTRRVGQPRRSADRHRSFRTGRRCFRM